MADPLDPEMLRKIADDPYFQTQIERQVRQRVNEQLDQTRKVLIPAIAILLAAGSFYSFTSIKDLNDKKEKMETKVAEKIKELDVAIEQVLKKSKDVVPVIEDFSRKSEAAKTQFDLYDRAANSLMGTFKDSMSHSLTSIRETHGELAREVAKFEGTQSKAADEAHTLLAQLESERKNLDATKEQLNGVAEKAKGEVAKANSIRTQLEDEQKRFRRANVDLLKATQMQYLLMHSHAERTLTMYAPRASGPADSSRDSALDEYRIKFETQSVRAGARLKITVIQGAAGKAGPPMEYALADGVRGPIEGTPFDYEVQFIYRATLVTHHFMVLRVLPHDSVATQ